ncbi:MAG: RNA polymerase sigma factor [Acidimicrobiales bacterium]
MPSAGEIYRALAPAVLGYLRAQRAPEPEDVLGEVFLQVARDLGTFRGDDDALRRWVFAIAHNRLLDARRRVARRPATADRPVPEQAAPPPDVGLDPALVDALDELTPDQREVVVLRFVADLSLADVAQLTRRRVGAVKALQHRALETLARCLSTGPPDEGPPAGLSEKDVSSPPVS